jgi:CRISPR-associated protein Cas1
MLFTDTLYGVVKNRVLVLDGFVMSVSVELGRLKIRDGIKGAVVERSFPRAGCPFNRLITTQTEGSVSLAALRWLADAEIAVACLSYDGTPLFTPGRSLAYAMIHTKVAGQIDVLKEMGIPEPEIERQAKSLAATFRKGSLHQTLHYEGTAAALYWNAFAETPVRFAGRDKKSVPTHWQSLGPRRSPITKTPQRAATPGHAVLNYLLGVAVSELTIAAHAAGLDPALGILHVDRAGRASLAYDLVEMLRTSVDRWLFRFLAETTFSKRDFFEARDGTVSIARPMTSHLAMTAAIWRPQASEIVRWFVGELSQSRQKGPRRAPKITHAYLPSGGARAIPHTCAYCGAVVDNIVARSQRRNWFCSPDCQIEWHVTRAENRSLRDRRPAA